MTDAPADEGIVGLPLRQKKQKPERILNSKPPFVFSQEQRLPINLKIVGGEPSGEVCGNARWSVQRQSQPEKIVV